MRVDDLMPAPDALCAQCTHWHTHFSLPLHFPSELVLPGDSHHYVSCQFPLTSLNSAGLPTELSIQMQLRIEREKLSLYWCCIFVWRIASAFWWEQNALPPHHPPLPKHEGKTNANGSLGVKHFFPPSVWSHVSALSQYSQSAKLWEAFVNMAHSFFGVMLSVVTMRHKQLLPHMAQRNDKYICKPTGLVKTPAWRPVPCFGNLTY